MSGGVRPSVVAALIVMVMTMSAFAVIGAQGPPPVASKPITGIENPVTVTKAQGADNGIARTWVAPVNGYFHQWLENDGLKGITIYSYDITASKPSTCSASSITFSAWGAYPTGTVQLGYFEVVKDHIYKWTFSPSGRAGTSAQYFWMLETKLTPPVASFALSYTGTILQADASSSYDPDGTIVHYIWEWGDGMVSNGVKASHQYDTYGGHQVTLTLVDSDNLKSALTKSIPPPPPLTVYGYTLNSAGASVSGSVVTAIDIRSGASVGAVSDGIGFYQLDLNTVSGGWKVGDVIEVAATWGTLSGLVQITMTDPNPSSLHIDVTMSGTVNLPPVASFTLTYSGTVLVADASSSFDPDGMIVYYLWDWHDGTTSPGLVASHAYPVAEGHLVTLTVTDNEGLSVSMTQSKYPPFPFFLFGYTLDQKGAALAGSAVTVTNMRTGASVSTVSDASAIYSLDVDSLYGGWQVGDVVEVSATLGTMSGSNQAALTNPNLPYVQVDVYLS